MFQTKIFFGRMDEGVVGPASLPGGEGVENNEDEKLILGDQDETRHGTINDDDQAMGGMGTDDIGLESGAFARGEIDLAEQMDRATRAMDRATHRGIDVAPPAPLEGPVNANAADSQKKSHDSDRH